MAQHQNPKSGSVLYRWNLANAEVVEQKTRLERSVTRIEARQLTITVSADAPGLWVQIEGRSIKNNGDYGQHNRSVAYETVPPPWREKDPSRSIEAMPDWARPYLEQVEEWEARR